MKNIIWTVCGDYTLEAKPDVEAFLKSKYIALYDGIKQGAFAKYFEMDSALFCQTMQLIKSACLSSPCFTYRLSQATVKLQTGIPLAVLLNSGSFVSLPTKITLLISHSTFHFSSAISVTLISVLGLTLSNPHHSRNSTLLKLSSCKMPSLTNGSKINLPL